MNSMKQKWVMAQFQISEQMPRVKFSIKVENHILLFSINVGL